MTEEAPNKAWWSQDLSIVLGKLQLTPAQRIVLKNQLGLSEAGSVQTYTSNTGNDGITVYGHDGKFQGDYEIKRLDDGGLAFKGIKGAEFETKLEHGDTEKLERKSGIERSGEHMKEPTTFEMGHSGQARGAYGSVEIREGTIDRDGSTLVSTEKTEIAGINVEASAKVALQSSSHPEDFFGVSAKAGVFGPSYEHSVSKLTALTPNDDNGFSQQEYSAKVSLESGLGAELKLSPGQFSAKVSEIIGAGVAAGIATRSTVVPHQEEPEDGVDDPEVIHADPNDPSIVKEGPATDDDKTDTPAIGAGKSSPY